MNVQVYPLQITQVDWKTYIKVVQDAMGVSPTRGLDACGMTLDKPSAFLYTLDLTNQPQQAIKQKEMYQHVFASFIIYTDFETDLPVYTQCSVYYANGDGQLLIVSKTLQEWDYIIATFMRRDCGARTRLILNKIKNYLERAGFHEIWAEYEELPHADGTFTLRRK